MLGCGHCNFTTNTVAPCLDRNRKILACKKEKKRKATKVEEFLPTPIKGKEAHCLIRAAGPLHQKPKNRKASGASIITSMHYCSHFVMKITAWARSVPPLKTYHQQGMQDTLAQRRLSRGS
eukprot:27462-Pelagomonas_calceolata.AAC.1